MSIWAMRSQISELSTAELFASPSAHRQGGGRRARDEYETVSMRARTVWVRMASGFYLFDRPGPRGRMDGRPTSAVRRRPFSQTRPFWHVCRENKPTMLGEVGT